MTIASRSARYSQFQNEFIAGVRQDKPQTEVNVDLPTYEAKGANDGLDCSADHIRIQDTRGEFLLLSLQAYQLYNIVIERRAAAAAS